MVVFSLRFGGTKLFPEMLSAMRFSGTFWFYSGVLLVVTVFSALVIPENKGESLVRTEDKFQEYGTMGGGKT